MNQKLLYIDGLNFGENFGLYSWDFTVCQGKIYYFIQCAQRSGFTPVVFIDGVRATGEALDKYKSRHEDAMRKGIRNAPPSPGLIIGSIFQSYGVRVYYSKVDNDDTLATYAHYDGADILSNDKDFFRYHDRAYKVYGKYWLKQDKLILVAKRPPAPEYMSSPRELFQRKPEVFTNYTDLIRYKWEVMPIFGSPSPLTRSHDNLYVDPDLKQIRAHIYLRANLSNREETILLSTGWHKIPILKAKMHLIGPKEQYIKLLSNLRVSNTTAYLPKYKLQQHLQAIKIIICQYYHIISTLSHKTPKTFVDLMKAF